MLYVEINADMNDGDYTAQITMLPDDELEDLRVAVTHIQNFNKTHPWGHNFPMGDCDDSDEAHKFYKEHGMTEKQSGILAALTPGGGDYPTHSIESITVYTVTNVETLL